MSPSPRPEGTLAFPLPRTAEDAGDGANGVVALSRKSRGRRRRHRGGLELLEKSASLNDMLGKMGSSPAPVSSCDSGSRSSSSRGILHPPDVVLSPRADAWVYLAASAAVGASSLSRAHARYASNNLYWVDAKMGAPSASIVALLSVEAAMALGVGVAYRFRPSLDMLSRLPLELISAAVALLLWAICMALFNTASVEDGVLGEMARPGSDAWDANFFYSLWIAGICSLYIVSDLCAGNAPSGRIPTSIASATTTTDKTARIWILLLFSSVLLCSFSVAERQGPVCRGAYIRDSPYCTSTTVSLVASVLSAATCLAKMAAGRLIRGETGRRLREASEGLMALPVLVGYACNAGFTTGPGGSGSNVGNLYVSSWLGLVLALLLNVEYLTLHFSRLDEGGGRGLGATAALSGRGGTALLKAPPPWGSRERGDTDPEDSEDDEVMRGGGRNRRATAALSGRGGAELKGRGGSRERGDTDPEEDSEDDAVILPPDVHQLPQIRYLHAGDRRDGSGSGSGARRRGRGARPRTPEPGGLEELEGLERSGMLYASTLRSLGTEMSASVV